MRPFRCICTVIALCAGGCAAVVARSGVDPSDFTTREQVHQTFGKPEEVSGAEGEPCEDYCYHGKVAENMRAAVLMLEAYGSLGLGDWYLVPCEVARACWMPLRGYDLRFYYDSEGNVTKHMVEGLPGMPWPLAHQHDTPAANSAPPPGEPTPAQ